MNLVPQSMLVAQILYQTADNKDAHYTPFWIEGIRIAHSIR